MRMVLSLALALTACGAPSEPVTPAGDAPAPAPDTPLVFRGSLKVQDKPDEHACRSVERVTEDLVVEAPGLVALDLRGPTTVDDDLFIASNTALTNLDLTDLTTIGGGLFIWDNGALVDTPGLRNVRSVGGELHVTNNAALERLTLGSVRAAKTVRITGNPKLAALAGLAQLESITGDLVIEDNAALATLPFDALREVTGSIRIEHNPRLPMCAADALIQRLRDAGYGGRATVANNDGTTSCE